MKFENRLSWYLYGAQNDRYMQAAIDLRQVKTEKGD